MAATPNYRIQGRRIAEENGIPWNIFNQLVNAESGWNPAARSPVGARGLTQLMPGTASGLGVNPDDPIQNLEGGAKYLSSQFKKFGRWDLALAAYNAGPGAVSKYGGIPPYKETQAYVQRIMAAAHQAGVQGGLDPFTGAPAAPPIPNGPVANPTDLLRGGQPGAVSPAMRLQQLLDASAPSPAAVNILAGLGGMASRAAQSAQAPIPVPGANDPVPQDIAPVTAQGPTDPTGGNTGAPQDPYTVPTVPLSSKLNGQVPMHTGGNIAQMYPNLQAQGQVDWNHINPRMLQALQKVAQKNGFVVVLSSGYRSNAYSEKVGGFANDPHTKGIAVDAYVNGHPIGDVVSPEEWSKYGVRSGNTPGFYNGKPDPEHLDLIGIPVKGGK